MRYEIFRTPNSELRTPNLISTKVYFTNSRNAIDRPLTFLHDNSFDLIVSSLTVHYLPDWTKVFQEFNRLLLPEGLFLFSTHHPFTDFLLFEKIDYFTRELIEDEWYSFGNKPVKVRFYRRPLHDTIEALTKAGFAIEKIIEPRPTKECRHLYPQDYEKLSTKPWFLIILARKKS